MQVPGFTAIRRLGSADSTMWLGTEDASGEPVTLRLLRGDAQTLRDGLSSAALVMRALNHPHIIPFLDLVDSPQGPVLILGAAEGGCLADVLVARRVLPPGEMVTACAPVSEALAEIHQHGIVHGAITPDEIVFDRDGRPMLAGVGLASIGAQLPLRGPTIAPETMHGTNFAPPADVYGIAAVGVLALTGPVAPDQLYAASAERLLATGMAPAAQAVITRAIGRNVTRRPDAATVVNALYAIADPEPVELIPPEAMPASPPPLAFPEPGPITGQMPPVTGQMPPVTPAHETTGTFESAVPDELDEVTAYMRRTTAPAPGRRARRKPPEPSRADEPTAAAPSARPVDEPSAAETTGVGRRARRVEDPPARGRGPGGHGGESGSAKSRPSRSSERPAKKSGGSGDRPRGRRPSRGDMTRVASVLVVLLLVAGAVIIGMQVFGGEEDQLPEAGVGAPDSVDGAQVDLCGGPRPAPEEEPPEVTDWTQEVQRLYSLRARAFEEMDAELLCQVYAPTSDGLVGDVELMQEWADNGVRAQNLTFEVIDAELIEQNGGTVVVQITDRRPPYQMVDNDGNVVQEQEGMEEPTWEAELLPIADEGSDTPTWRFG